MFLHVMVIAGALWTPSSAKYRFYGSGTAVSLVGADEIPGGSARGKSGDRPESVKKPKAAGAKKARKIAVKKKKKKAKTKSRKKRVRKKKKNVRKLAVKEKAVKEKKKISKKRLAKLKAIKARRDRLKRWKKEYGKAKKKKPAPAPKKKVAKKKPGGDDRLAKNVSEPPPKPRAGFLGGGGGDGQGGGSRGGGSGGVARTEIERYYGLLAERVRNNWTVPMSLADVEKLKAEIIFDVARDGVIRDLRIEKSSGNRVYDAAALRAVKRSSDPAFPPLPNTVKDEWLPLGFRFCGQNFCKQ